VSNRPIGVDLFAGAGGLSLGFEWAGFDVRAAVELDPIHCAIHAFNFPRCAAICRSVSDIDGDYIREHSSIGCAEVDVVFGGAPCQGFSLIGKRSFEDPRNRLVFDFVRLVCDLDSKYFVFENVKGLTIGKHRQFLDELVGEFQKSGYQVRLPYDVLNAASFGVPQERHRLFLLGAKEGLPLPEYPSPTHNPKRQANGNSLPFTPTVWDAIGDLPEADAIEQLSTRDWVMAKFKRPSEYARLLRQNPDSNSKELLTSSLRTVHTELSTKRFDETNHGETEPVSRFHKLNPFGSSNTIRAGTASDRGAFTSPRPVHPYTPRCITVREAARLHSYPDWFRFHVTKWHGFRQVGNSVPPLLARAVATRIWQSLGRRNRALEPLRALGAGDPVLLQLDMSGAAQYFQVPKNTIPARRRVSEAVDDEEISIPKEALL
jgi:DNA (cytosine-5)-methyltransferase 1